MHDYRSISQIKFSFPNKPSIRRHIAWKFLLADEARRTNDVERNGEISAIYNVNIHSNVGTYFDVETDSGTQFRDSLTASDLRTLIKLKALCTSCLAIEEEIKEAQKDHMDDVESGYTSSEEGKIFCALRDCLGAKQQITHDSTAGTRANYYCRECNAFHGEVSTYEHI